jgi:hypothetical protein
MIRLGGFVLFCLGIGLCIVRQPTIAVQAAEDAEKAFEIKLFYGHWRVERFQWYTDGETTDLYSEILKQTLSIAPDGKITLEFAGVKTAEWTAEYNAKKAPVWINLNWVFHFGKKESGRKQALGIISVHDDRLMICIGIESRPANFEKTMESESLLIVAKRVQTRR